MDGDAEANIRVLPRHAGLPTADRRDREGDLSDAGWADVVQTEDPRHIPPRVPVAASNVVPALELAGEFVDHCPQCGLRISRSATLPRRGGEFRRQGIRCGFDT